MELGMIGLGRMGANMVERLMKAGHTAWSMTATPMPCSSRWQRVRKGTTSPDGLRQGACPSRARSG